jgi:hypothetical protein
MSVLATCRQQARDALTYVSQSLCGFMGNLFTHVTPALER